MCHTFGCDPLGKVFHLDKQCLLLFQSFQWICNKLKNLVKDLDSSLWFRLWMNRMHALGVWLIACLMLSDTQTHMPWRLCSEGEGVGGCNVQKVMTWASSRWHAVQSLIRTRTSVRAGVFISLTTWFNVQILQPPSPQLAVNPPTSPRHSPPRQKTQSKYRCQRMDVWGSGLPSFCFSCSCWFGHRLRRALRSRKTEPGKADRHRWRFLQRLMRRRAICSTPLACGLSLCPQRS